MKFSKILTALLAGVIAVSCYNKFELETSVVRYDDNYMEQVLGLKHITIAELKAKFGEISGTGITNDNWSRTKYIHFVHSTSECTEFELKDKRYEVGDYYIKGKVITSDEQGNIYKSLYIFDGTEAIELKLTNGLYIEYPCDVREGGETMWVYVKVTGLYLGNFRMMLSLGDGPTEGYNSLGRYKCYPNSNINSSERVKQFVFKGEKDVLTQGRFADETGSKKFDILVIDENSYSDLRKPAYFGRLMKFENVEVMYQGVTDQEGIKPSAYDDSTPYPSWICTSGTIKGNDYFGKAFVSKPWGKLAYSMENQSLYGQMLVGYNKNATATSDAGVYVVRTSGYSRYAYRYVPRNGTKGSITGIYAIYSQTSSYTGGSTDYATYQLSPCKFEDILPEYYGAADYETVELPLMAKWESEQMPEDSESYRLPLTQDDDDLE